MVANAGLGSNYFNLWLKANHYSVVQTNVLPTAGNVVSVVTAFAFGIYADRTGQRLYAIIAIQLLLVLSNTLLSIWSIPTGALLFAFYLSYISGAAQPIIIVRSHRIYEYYMRTEANMWLGLGSRAQWC